MIFFSKVTNKQTKPQGRIREVICFYNTNCLPYCHIQSLHFYSSTLFNPLQPPSGMEKMSQMEGGYGLTFCELTQLWQWRFTYFPLKDFRIIFNVQNEEKIAKLLQIQYAIIKLCTRLILSFFISSYFILSFFLPLLNPMFLSVFTLCRQYHYYPDLFLLSF